MTAGRFQNPVLPGFYPDPSVCRVGADYYLVTSSFEYFPGVPIFTSQDLVSWRQIGHCLTRESQLALAGVKASQGIFAPTLRFHAGTFYLVTTNISGGGNFFVTTRDPAGPWSDPVWLEESAWGMDPSLCFDDDGRVYFTRHGGGERGGIYQAEVDLERGALLGEAKLIWSGTGGIWPEGPHLYRRGDHYYLLIAEGGTGYDHWVTVARATSPWGPFEACPHNPVLTHRARPEHPIQATGHADLVDDAAGRSFCVFLGIRPSGGRYHHLGRETFLASVDWDTAGWPSIRGGAGVELELESPAELSPAGSRAASRDDFTGPALGFAWNFVRNPLPGSWSLCERPSFLRLHGVPGSLDDLAPKAFVGRRQQHFGCTASTLLEFEPEGAEEAGLCVRANEENHYDLFVTSAGAGRAIVLRARRLAQTETVLCMPIAPGAVELTIQAQPNSYEFFWSQRGVMRSLGSLPTRHLSTEIAGGFTGVYFGMYALGASARADFDWFDYLPSAE
jgi:alpha-N-arabinofuranosidase